MSNGVNEVIDSIGHTAGERITDAVTDSLSAFTSASRTPEPTPVAGYPAEEPITERVSDILGNVDGIRRTRTGAIDGRSTRRGRPRNATGTTTETATVSLGSFSVGDLLLGIHSILAAATKTPELELDKKSGEHTRLGDAMQGVAAQYGHQINPKVAAWFNLGIVAAGVYGTRFAAIKMRLDMEERGRRLKVASISSGHTNGHAAQPIQPPVPETDNGGLN